MLNNNLNSYCYLIATVQRLHSCKTVNEYCQKNFDEATDVDKHVKDTLKPLSIYSKLTIDKLNDEKLHEEIYRGITEWLDEYIQKYIGKAAQDGYLPETYLVYAVLPSLYYHVTKHAGDNARSVFQSIVNELRLDPNVISTAGYVYRRTITDPSQAFFNDSHMDIAVKLYEEMPKDINCTTPKETTTAIIEIYPEKSNPCIGHAATLVKQLGTNKLYIIDDTRCITDIETYVKEYNNKIAHMDIRDIDETTVAYINSLRLTNAIKQTGLFEHRLARYTLEFNDKEITSVAKGGLQGAGDILVIRETDTSINWIRIILLCLFSIVIAVLVSALVNLPTQAPTDAPIEAHAE